MKRARLLYVGGLIIFEKDEGRLSAVIVSPLRTSEYLLSKVVTLTHIALALGVVLQAALVVALARRFKQVAYE